MYLLSAGLFSCGRCGSDLLGMRKTATASYYICGSQPHRRGLGCGQAVYIPQAEVESEVILGLTGLLDLCADTNGFARKANEELRRIWADSVGFDPRMLLKLKEIDAKIADIRKAVENGLPDCDGAFTRMRELATERAALCEQTIMFDEPPQIDAKTAVVYRSQTNKILAMGTSAEKKPLIR